MKRVGDFHNVEKLVFLKCSLFNVREMLVYVNKIGKKKKKKK